MLSLLKIDGKSYDVLVTAIEETSEIVEGGNTGFSLYRNREIRDMLGIRIGHNITVDPDINPEAYDELYNYLFGSLRESVVIETVHNQETISYEAAYNIGNRHVQYIDEKRDFVGWAGLTIAFRPIECQITERANLALSVLGDMILGNGG